MPTAWARQVVVSEAEADAGATLERVRYVRNVFDEVDAFIGSFVLTASEQENLGDEEEIRELFYERIAGLWFDKGRMSDGAARTRRHNRELAAKYLALLGMTRSGKAVRAEGGLSEEALNGITIPRSFEHVLSTECGYTR